MLLRSLCIASNILSIVPILADLRPTTHVPNISETRVACTPTTEESYNGQTTIQLGPRFHFPVRFCLKHECHIEYQQERLSFGDCQLPA
ncbi:hypothetical protein BO82DRAFT_196365 [Aspergillus uvarum CBS 121591]|uniref:ZP domain-containing protein n=1 Tax=Aspergillus uvarum CBS 121591 TaxID=1448315 RepID=A0A319BZ52_9EURO|nr:hypothetical protein BO82DRAFT_196365 [Aspergillus uvarum CBS 121591]PYH76730.1 hypothetical protein BO82DRAFT_196365 [Aspergillus uvarum CBS 121591]